MGKIIIVLLKFIIVLLIANILLAVVPEANVPVKIIFVFASGIIAIVVADFIGIRGNNNDKN